MRRVGDPDRGAHPSASPASEASTGGPQPTGVGLKPQPETLAFRCPGCAYVYKVEAGDEHEGFAAGTSWAEIPDTWCCPDCGVREKDDFVPLATEPA